MSTPATPSQPTEAELYAAYQNLFDILNSERLVATGAAVLPLNNAAQAVSDVLMDGNQVALQANAAAFTALTPQMKRANDALKTLKAQLSEIASIMGDVAKVLAAINVLLEIIAKFQ